MANWANVRYALTGNKESLEAIMSVIERECDLSDILDSLEIGYPHELNTMGVVHDFWMDKGTLNIFCKCAWNEASGWRSAIKSRFSDIDIYYYMKECSNCIYATNDLKGEYFKTRYVLNTYRLDFDLLRFESFTSLKEYLSETIGLSMDCSLSECNRELERYARENKHFNEVDAHVYEVELRND